ASGSSAPPTRRRCWCCASRARPPPHCSASRPPCSNCSSAPNPTRWSAPVRTDMDDGDLLDQVTVVLVTYHSAHCIHALDALLAHCPHVVISDNGSTDGTPAQARACWPRAAVLEHGRNLGFGTANNRALAQVRTPFAFLLNPDCEVTPDGLRALVRAAQDMPEAAIVAPQLQGEPGRPDVNYRWPNVLWKSSGPGA